MSADAHRLRSRAHRLLTLALAVAAALILSSPPATRESHAEGPTTGPITINVSGPASVAEGETATYTISLSPEGVIPPPGANLAVNYRTRAGTAIQLNQKNRNIADYDWVNALHTFNADNPGPVKVSVRTFDDNRVEPDETFQLEIVEGYFAMGGLDDRLRPRFGTSSVTTTITDDDVVGTDISLSVSPPAMAEDDGPMSFVVTAALNNGAPAPNDIEVAITLGGTAEKGSDYIVKAALSSITIPEKSSSGSGTLTLVPIDDTVVEADEVVTVSGSAAGLSVDPAMITLDSQMTDVAHMRISGPPAEVEEGADAVFTATLDNLVSSEITVEWRGQSPDCCDFAEPSDYGSGYAKGRYSRGSFTIPANTLKHTFSVAVNDDDLAEPMERFAILIGEISGAGLTDGAITASAKKFEARGFASIAASDGITVNLSGPVAVDEDSGTAVYTVSLSGGVPIGDIAVSYATADGTALAGSDYSSKSGTLRFTPANYADRTIAVPISDDALEEQDETFRVVLTGVSGGGGHTPVLGRSSVTTTIRGLAPPPVTIVPDDVPDEAPDEPPDVVDSPPGRPSNLSVAPPPSSTGSSTVTFRLSWRAPADGGAPTGYKVLRRAPATESNFRVLGSVSGSATTFTDSTANPRTAFIYRVKAVNALGESQPSGPAQIFFRPVGPGRAGGLSARLDASGTSVVLSWNAPSGGSAPTGYQILRRAVGRESRFVVLAGDTGSTATTFIDSTAAPGTKYVYRVKARNSVGLGQESLPAYIVIKRK